MCSIFGFCGKTDDPDSLRKALAMTVSRGPDMSRILDTGHGYLGFNRLSIMGLTEEGMQPFVLDPASMHSESTGGEGPSSAGFPSRKSEDLSNLPDETAARAPHTETAEAGSVDDSRESSLYPSAPDNALCLVCNGEIYGFRPMKEELMEKGYTFQSDSDCEILLPLYLEYGTDLFRMLDAEFALILHDGRTGSWIAARDPIGIRPLYYGIREDGTYVFASEPKNLISLVGKISPFPPGHYFKDGSFTCYRDPSRVSAFHSESMDETCRQIHDRLIKGVEKRLDSDVPLGFLLSGGLDSSLVCGIAARLLDRPLETWSIGMDTDAIDLKYAKEVADFIHSDHHEVIISREDVLSALEEVIYALATYDITTIRASVGMYLVCKAIHESSDIRVILTGEISDEIFGYKYTDFAPSAEEFQKEAEKRIREIHMYDVLRADRCISVHSLEARVPFGDLDFVEYCMAIDPEMKLNRYGKGKYLLRRAFQADDLLPEDILMREKAAFSDAVGHSLKDDLTEYAESLYTEEEFRTGVLKYSHARPFTKESLLYRDIFEKYYPGQSEMVKDFWMPNRSWEGCNVTDPSARVLSNYGASGE